MDLPGPCKVFGDIHGQFTDLKKFFATYGVFVESTFHLRFGILQIVCVVDAMVVVFRVTQSSHWRRNFVPVCVHRRLR